ncbi:PQQ-binding-like beta-propeller repeat protein [Actinoplanes couchii]|uniref:Pyrrolo-quinoline quinone n=1 Tax=Actinoplanes couchii TaxID=403638 RepID=A0ABQ3XGP2_9ACTN|nr:PQQ-binding-like beta-propeller repeat protein [Actinoplanes couchii]MDR6320851.1 hypothetical protein [Actinoplanes couchii]GID57665.1 hypothetical protein Aco03nite_060690 [Actinoplanes couchii]
MPPAAALRVDRILGDRPLTEIGRPTLAIRNRPGPDRREMLAVAGAHQSGFAPVAVYNATDLRCRAVVRSRFPVHTMAFHPEHPLLTIGTGRYDGGYFFEGELLLLNWKTGTTHSLIDDHTGRQILDLEWLNSHELRILRAPSDDGKDPAARSEGYVSTVIRKDWRKVEPHRLKLTELAGPRVPAPRDPYSPQVLAARLKALPSAFPGYLTTAAKPRREVRAVEMLPDGRILAALDGVIAEAWSRSGDLLWSVPDAEGGRDLVVTTEGVWAGVVHPGWEQSPRILLRLALDDGAELDRIDPGSLVTLVPSADGQPATAPIVTAGSRADLRIRRGSRIYTRAAKRPHRSKKYWLAAAEFPGPSVPRLPSPSEFHRLFPFSWEPNETHFAGPGVEAADGSLIHAGTVYNGLGLQPGGAFVVSRNLQTGTPNWVFRSDHPATALDANEKTIYIAYNDGEVVALNLRSGTPEWHHYVTLSGVPVVSTALTTPSPGRLLLGTTDGRILDCSVR